MADVHHAPSNLVEGNHSAEARSVMYRRLAALLCADIVGYSRLVGVDEPGTFQRIKALRTEVLDPLVTEHGGRICSYAGDGALAEFPSVVRAVECALAIQGAAAEREPDVPPTGAWPCGLAFMQGTFWQIPQTTSVVTPSTLRSAWSS